MHRRRDEGAHRQYYDAWQSTPCTVAAVRTCVTTHISQAHCSTVQWGPNMANLLLLLLPAVASLAQPLQLLLAKIGYSCQAGPSCVCRHLLLPAVGARPLHPIGPLSAS